MRRLTAVLLAAATAATLSACTGDESTVGGGIPGGSGSTDKNLVNLVREVRNAIAGKETVLVNVGMALGEPGNVTGTGKLRLTPDRPASQLKMTVRDAAAAGGLKSGETITIGDVRYLNGSLPASNGKPWLKVAAGAGNQFVNLLTGLGDAALQSAAPGNALQQFSTGGRLTGKSEATLNGQPSTKYDVRINLRRVVQTTRDRQLKSLLGLVVQSGVTDYPVTMWVDGNNLPMQLKTNSPLPILSAGQSPKERIAVTVRYRDWGKPVDIAPPPAGQVGELRLPDLSGLGRPGSGG